MSLRHGTVIVPTAILLDPRLSLNARLAWIYLQAESDQGETADLTPHHVKACRLTRPTIRRALHELRAAGLLSQGTRHAAQQHVLLPTDILLDHQLGPWEILLYGVLQLTDGFHDNGGYFTYNEIQSIAGASPRPLRRAARTLNQTAWLKVFRGKKFKPIRFKLQNPEAERCEAVIGNDNARPGFLVNAFTEELMEFDRYYMKDDVAWEFNGPQHHGPTEKFPSVTKARWQQGRDMLKRTICADKGIHLIIVHAEDLTLATMQTKVGKLLPLRDLSRDQPIIDYLGTLSAESKK